MNMVRDAAWTVDADGPMPMAQCRWSDGGGPMVGVHRLAPAGLYGWRKMIALQPDGTWRLHGEKIFISGDDPDLTDNLV